MIDFIKFVEEILGMKLLPHQKKLLRMIEKCPETPQMLYARGQATSKCFYGWFYKKMWEEYCETGHIKFLDELKDNSESFEREYECIWGEENES